MSDRVEALRRIADWIEAEVDALAAEALRRMQAREPRILTAVAGRRSQASADVTEALRALAGAMRSGNAVGDQGTGGAVRFAAAAAAAGLQWMTFANAWSGYRATVADAVSERLAGGEREESPGGGQDQLAVMRFLLDYEDAIGAAVAGSFVGSPGREGEGVVEDRGTRIGELFAGLEVDPNSLPFDPADWHLAVVAWGAGDREAVEALAGFLGLEALVEQQRDAVWAWFHGTFEQLAEAVARVRDFPKDVTAQLALGEPGRGAEGFATSHLQACGAERVGVLSDAPLTLFVDVALEAFALDDEPLARDFVARELGPLTGDDVRAATLRQTLAAYFNAGNSASAAAAALGLHERTVSYRIRAAEQRLGRYIIDFQDNLALALRLYELFSRQGGPPTTLVES